MKEVDKSGALIALAELVIDVIGREFELEHPKGPGLLVLGDVAKSVELYARPENVDTLRGLVRKHYPDSSENTLANIEFGIKAATAIIKLAYCSAMMVNGNPVPLTKMALRDAFDLLRKNEPLMNRLMAFFRAEGIDPDDPTPPRGGRMRMSLPAQNAGAAPARYEERRVANGRMAGLSPKVS